MRLTLLDACYLHGGIEPRPGAAALLRPDAEAGSTRVEASCRPAPARRLGAAIHSTRAVQPEQAAIAERGRRERRAARCTRTSPSSAPRTRSVARSTAPPRPRCCITRAPCPTASRRSTPPTSPRRTSRCWASAGACCCLCPTTERDLADGIGPRRRLRAAGCVADDRQRLERGHRAARRGARDRARRAAGERRARRAHGAPRCSAAATASRLRESRLAARAARSVRAHSPTSSPSGSTACPARRVRAPAGSLDAVVFAGGAGRRDAT